MLAFFVSTAGHFPIVRRPNPVFGRFSHKAVRTAKYIRARKTKKGTNMKRCVINSFISALACLASFACPTASAQFVRSATGATQVADADSVWTLDECINYALKNNITLKQNVNNYLSGLEDTQQAKSGYSPTLSANAAVGSTNVSGAGTSMAEQITDAFHPHIPREKNEDGCQQGEDCCRQCGTLSAKHRESAPERNRGHLPQRSILSGSVPIGEGAGILRATEL